MGLLADEERGQLCDLPYTMHPEDVEPESVVDKLVEYAESGYRDSHNKITGTFTCPDYLGEYADNLYKGGIAQYFTQDHTDDPT